MPYVTVTEGSDAYVAAHVVATDQYVQHIVRDSPVLVFTLVGDYLGYSGDQTNSFDCTDLTTTYLKTLFTSSGDTCKMKIHYKRGSYTHTSSEITFSDIGIQEGDNYLAPTQVIDVTYYDAIIIELTSTPSGYFYFYLAGPQ